MTRVRWFKAEWPITIRMLASRMRQRPFTQDSTDGFMVDRTRDERIEGRYIEKLSFMESIVDPFGKELSFERVSYRQVEFIVHRDFPQIELREPPRGLQSFTSRLLELNDFRVSTSSMSVDLMKWIEAITSHISSELLVDSVQLSEIAFSPEVSGTMQLKSERDIRRALKDIIGSKTHRINKARVSWIEDGAPIVIQLNASGSANLDSERPEHITLLRESIPKA